MNTIITALCAFIFVIAILFNFRVGWANRRRHHDRRLVYFITAEVAMAAMAMMAWLTRESWLVKPALTCGEVGDNAGLACWFLLTMAAGVVLMAGGAVYCAGFEGEAFWAKRATKH